MHLRRLTLENFGPYYGVQPINLDVASDSPVVVIYGENTLRKSTLFLALRWCLYGSLSSVRESANEHSSVAVVLNNIARREGAETLSVTLAFDHDDQSYVLRRSATVRTGRPVTVAASLRVDASVIPTSPIDAAIGRIIHPQIADFFLFDAETLSSFNERLSDDRERGFIRESIEQVLGIPALQLAKRDVIELVNDALDRQSKANRSAQEAQKARQRLKKLASDLVSVNRSRAELEETISTAERELERTREALQRTSGIEADLREQETLEAQIKDGNRETAQIRSEIKLLFARGWMAVANKRLEEKLAAVRQANNMASNRAREISQLRQRVALLEGKLTGGVCPTCNQPVAVEVGVEKELDEARESLRIALEETSGGEIDLHTERRISGLIDKSILADFASRTKRLDELKLIQFERQTRLDSISDRLKGNSLAEIRRLGLQQQELMQIVKRSTSALEECKQEEGRIAQEQKKLARQLDRIPGADPKVVLEASFLRLVQEALDRTVGTFREQVRASVEDSASDIFLGLIRNPDGYGGLRISSDYRVHLVD